jgi:hypothetical protein
MRQAVCYGPTVWLLVGFFAVFRFNGGLWIMIFLTLFAIVKLLGFAVYGIIEARYHPMILPFVHHHPRRGIFMANQNAIFFQVSV